MSVFLKTIGSKAVGLSKSIRESFSEKFRATAKKTAIRWTDAILNSPDGLIKP
ncbi:MAG: hypothetical protein K1000chlam1_00715 [Candidatus Anoxychlamydiales bacterium]|nr:hypothetical protein [Candidatus Anoxychlamydiales bacterium]